MSRLPVHQLRTSTQELDLGEAKVYHLPDWHNLTHPQRLTIIRQVATMRGRDPRIARIAVKAIKTYRVRPREYAQQAGALLKWVQDPKNVYYVNEAGERLQDPVYTIEAGHGDCDDQVLTLCALFESVHLPWRLCLSGVDSQGQKVRYIEGSQVPGGCTWTHIYCVVGDDPFRPTTWYFAEPTVEGVPLGWDVISGDRAYLPPAVKRRKPPGPPQIALAGAPSTNFRPGRLPRQKNRSPAYDEAYGNSSLGPILGTAFADAEEHPERTWGDTLKAMIPGILVGVTVSVLAGTFTPVVREVADPKLRRIFGLPTRH